MSDTPSTPELPLTGYITASFVKKYFAISNSTLYSWLAASYLPPIYKVGPRAMRFRAQDIRKFEQERTKGDVKPR